ncbi:enoyl-CoA hydratase-related protein [Amycolatopsis sacchari]|uniref:Enoyl-CoA hydratase/carnithine racemase n=1 Tax=Amycolatopsis sacchari TaxID=115433 RepID=A0A1I3XJG9_9PSEU|nr:enoyl-CoA hydratase-related protein [Amycolatopsis sacchari]SFK19628.1 Enoyl-CoA hydratase/carnithine racemase [Amycolatopsis sacchari]
MAVRQEVRGRVLVVRIEREEKRNAIDVDTALGIDEALNRLDDEPDLWVGVLTGTRTVFSAGTDLKAGLDFRTERGGEYGVIRRQREKPLVAAVEGIAFGGGFEIALACDLVVASTAARFALPETLRGLVPTSGALFRAVRALPPHVAKELLITGAELSGERAHHFGLVNRLTEPGHALEGALAVAEEICSSSPVAVRAVLGAVAAQLADDDRRGWAETERAVESIRGSADRHEGIAAFFERRPPRWSGR